MSTKIRREPTVLRVVAFVTLLLAFIGAVMPAGASPPESVCIDAVANLDGTPGTWSASGLVNSNGTAEFNPFVAGWDSELGQPATVHDRFVATDGQGSITIRGQGHSALVVNENGDTVPGYNINWVIVSGTGAYANLHGQGGGYAYVDWVEFEFLAFQCGQAHYNPQ